MVREAYPNAPCCTNLYGEIMELWRDGHLRLPGDVVKIWADNGYGKMVSRRQGNNNPRIRALPARKDRGKHGLYYHVSFYDLQAGNHLTMLGNPPSFVQRELSEALSLGVNEYWIVNCSNIKPHVFYLGFIAEFWRNGHFDPEAYGKEYAARTYGAGNARMAAACFDSYFRHAVPYGTQEDEHAGDQFFNYVARILVSQYMKDGARRAEELLWAVDAATLREQTEWFQSVCKNAAIGYAEHAAFCEGAVPAPEDPARTLFESSLQVQADILRFSADGALLACRSLLKAMDGDDMRAFFLAGKSKKAFQQANAAMRGSESGKWIGFYANDCLTDVKQSAWLMDCLMGMLRNRGDGPYFYEWQREILYSRQDARVMLITNMENHLDNDELFQRMEIKWDAE